MCKEVNQKKKTTTTLIVDDYATILTIIKQKPLLMIRELVLNNTP